MSRHAIATALGAIALGAIAHGAIALGVVGLSLLVACDGEEPDFDRARANSARPEVEAAGPTPREFVDQFIAEVHRREPDTGVTLLGGMEVELRRPGATPPLPRMNLDNGWAECRPAPEHCPLVIERFASVFLQREPEPLSLDGLRLVLFGRELLVRQEMSAAAWAEPFAGDLVSAFVLDSADAIATLPPEQLEELALPRGQLRARALANMRRAFGPLRHRPFMEGAPVHVIDTSGGGVASDSYDAARLLLPELWAPLLGEVQGELIAAAPARDIALFTGSEDSRGIEGLAYLAREMYHGEPHPVSPQLVRWTPSGWIAFPSP